jgi:hypothetical protein
LVAKNDTTLLENKIKEAMNDAFNKEISELSKVIDPKSLAIE